MHPHERGMGYKVEGMTDGEANRFPEVLPEPKHKSSVASYVAHAPSNNSVAND